VLFPRARLRVRADAGFAEAKLLAFLDAAAVAYVLGLAGNRRLDKRVRRLLGRARMRARATGETATLYGETRYAARRWERKRRIILKAEVLCYPGRARKDNPRFLVTNLPHRPATVYMRLYCGRGDMENRLKELQQGVAMDRTSCSRFAANQLRLLFSVAAYVLFQTLQGFARASALGAAQVWTLRERLVKIAVWVERSVRRIVLHLPQAFPWRDTWRDLAHALTAT
jgi:Transposase DDE domain group 1